MLEWLFKYPRELFERGEIVFAPVSTAFDGVVVLIAAVVLVAVSLVVPRRIRELGWGRRLARRRTPISRTCARKAGSVTTSSTASQAAWMCGIEHSGCQAM